MGDIKIIEYKPSLAKAVAEMWRKSSEGWNGFYSDETEENVLKHHELGSDINTYLAVKDDEVLGYCGFSKYLEDEGALYIPLLNVRFDCHGMGIGRDLVINAVNRTIEEKWPRLDLYTWPGNTKSVPLYKKCGFFFEKRDDTTHLMNFIPTVMTTEAVEDYFRSADWYKDMKRELNMDPDGREENGFDFYEYKWEKDNKKLRMEFERKGRGLRLIETDDYKITMSAEEQKLVSGQKHKVIYEVINKSGKPLEISILGKDNKNIKFSFHKNLVINEEELIEGEFTIGEITDEYGEFKTHPAITSELLINGKRAEFKLGIVPVLPAKFSIAEIEGECYRDITDNLYIDIQNNLKNEAVFKFELPNEEAVKFHQNSFEITLKEKEKTSIKVPFTLSRFTFYNKVLKVTAELENSEKIQFNNNVAASFKGREGCFGGELDKYWIVTNGIYSVKYIKDFNALELEGPDRIKQKETIFRCPVIGKPYSEEFTNKKVKDVKWYKENDKIVMEIEYVSESFEGIKVIFVTKLSNDGIVENYYEIYNCSSTDLSKELWAAQGIYNNLCRSIIPYNNEILKLTDTAKEDIESIDIDKITENWIFSKDNGITRSLWWNKDSKINRDKWRLSMEHNLGKIPAGGKVVTEPIYAALDTFQSWQELRKFALKNNDINNKNEIRDFDMVINDGNPFVKENFIVEVKEYKEGIFLDGEITLNSVKGLFEPINSTFTSEDNVKETELKVSMKNGEDIDIVKLSADLETKAFEKKSAVFRVKDAECFEEIKEENDHKVYSYNNGVMTIKAAPTFSSALYSLNYKNHEWLENSFPTPKAKSWFNPWFGGIHTQPEDLSFRSILKEDIKAEFVSIEDNFNNLWKGIAVSVSVENNEKYKGLEYKQYFLTLPGLPVLCHTTEVIQNTGKYMNLTPVETYGSFNIDKNLKNNWLMMKDREDSMVKYKVGRAAMDIRGQSSILFGSDNINEKIQLVSHVEETSLIGFINITDTSFFSNEHIKGENGEKIFKKPLFYVFTDEYVEDKLLKDLKNIRFE